jgi:hypothetical protein
MPSSIQSLVLGALSDLSAVSKLEDHELLAADWLWALRDAPIAVRYLTNEQVHSLFLEDLLMITSLEGQGRKVAQTIDGMTRFLDADGKARVNHTCFNDARISALILRDKNGRIRLNPRHVPEASSASTKEKGRSTDQPCL